MKLTVGSSLGLLALLLASRPLEAQSSTCDYSSCALTIVPAWNGLAAVRGTGGPRVANLSFFWPRDISAALKGESPSAPGADSAAAHARRAVQIRRVAATLTDAGIVLTALTLARVFHTHMDDSDRVIAVIGAASLGVSVPLQFAADGALSRAVWWHNVRYAR